MPRERMGPSGFARLTAGVPSRRLSSWLSWTQATPSGGAPSNAFEVDRDPAAERAGYVQELREMAGKTQGKVAEALGITQPQVSQFEHRDDFLLSTLKRYVEALGGELEVRATFGDRSVRIRSAA